MSHFRVLAAVLQSSFAATAQISPEGGAPPCPTAPRPTTAPTPPHLQNQPRLRRVAGTRVRLAQPPLVCASMPRTGQWTPVSEAS
jgi:hypothetical protein